MKRWKAGEAETLKLLDRKNCPALTDSAAWASFPYSSYDIVVIDSWSAATEGVKEKEAGENSKAMASILDNARKGPGVLLLANCRKDEGVLRGSGVIGDRADIVYEIRDTTELKLDVKHEHWLDALPPADETQWAARAKRRKRRDKYRLAFVTSKFRVGEEPDPFILEIRLPEEGDWSIADVTTEVEDELALMKGAAIKDRGEREATAIETLKRAIATRCAAGNPLSGTEADEILDQAMAGGRDRVRQIRKDGIGIHWRVNRPSGKGSGAKSLYLPISAANSDGSQTHTQTIDSEQLEFAGAGAQGPQTSPALKSHADKDLADGQSLRPVAKNVRDRERI